MYITYAGFGPAYTRINRSGVNFFASCLSSIYYTSSPFPSTSIFASASSDVTNRVPFLLRRGRYGWRSRGSTSDVAAIVAVLIGGLSCPCIHPCHLPRRPQSSPVTPLCHLHSPPPPPQRCRFRSTLSGGAHCVPQHMERSSS